MGQYKRCSNDDLYGTYETEDAWITPLGEYNIIHYDCPDKEEIKARVTETINELIEDDCLEDGCPLCEMMKGKPYDVIYHCVIFCHNCKKAAYCKNFDPDSRAEEEALDMKMERWKQDGERGWNW